MVFTAMNVWSSFSVQKAFEHWQHRYKRARLIREAKLSKMLQRPYTIRYMSLLASQFPKRKDRQSEQALIQEV